MIDIGRNVIEGFWEGIQNAKEWLFEKVTEFWTLFIEYLIETWEEIVGEVRSVLDEFFGWCLSMIQSILSGIASIASAAAGISFSGGFGGAAPAISTFSTQSFATLTADLPHLVSGSVIRGGNPFMAILGDQRVGQTNVEAPLSTIEQAVDNVLNRKGYGAQAGGSFDPVIALNVNGEEFARLTLNDIFQEAARQGYDVSVLGVT